MSDHPGGVNLIVLASGVDAFDSDTAKTMLIKYHIGTLERDTAKKTTTIHENVTSTQEDIFLRQKK